MVDNSLTKTKGRSKSEEKRQKILNAAADLFLSHGFENTSMDQVAVDAGVSKQTVYSHFGNKEELFSSIIEYKCVINDLTDELFDYDLPVADVLAELAEHFTNLVMSDEAIKVKRVCVAETPQRVKVSKLFWNAGPERLTRCLAQYLTEQNKRGNVQIENSHFAAQQFLYMITAEAHLLKFLDQPYREADKELPAYLKSCVELFKKAYIN
jgi:TetR/AcrR family transcriptional regulator, mexJK operon transcriptional repressor